MTPSTPRAEDQPEVTVPDTAPTELVVTDIEVGTGATAKNGKTLSMQYVGVAFSTKEQFDASWDSPGAEALPVRARHRWRHRRLGPGPGRA